MIRHLLCVDMDCFFVSVERALNPYLNNHILIVAHHNSRSVVTSCCYKARQYGVRAGMSLEKAKKKCPRAKIIEPNLNEYTNYSRKVYTFLKTVSPELEKGSIDEFYIDLTGCERLYGSITKIAELIKLEIKNKIQLPCSIGIGTNKMIAKIASNLAKPEGIVSVEKGGEKLFLEPLPINIIPGVGKTTRELLNERGIWTIKQLAKIPKSYLKLLLGQQGEKLHYSSLGVGDQKCRNDSLGKSIGSETTFQIDTANPTIIKRTLSNLIEKISFKLRKTKQESSCVTLKIRYSNFKTQTKQICIEPTDQDQIIYKHTISLLNSMYKNRLSVRLVGIKLSKLNVKVLNNLFPLFQKTTYLYQAIDKIKLKYGLKSIQQGSSLR